MKIQRRLDHKKVLTKAFQEGTHFLSQSTFIYVILSRKSHKRLFYKKFQQREFIKFCYIYDRDLDLASKIPINDSTFHTLKTFVLNATYSYTQFLNV